MISLSVDLQLRLNAAREVSERDDKESGGVWIYGNWGWEREIEEEINLNPRLGTWFGKRHGMSMGFALHRSKPTGAGGFGPDNAWCSV